MCTLFAVTLSIITSGYLTLHARSLTSWSATLSRPGAQLPRCICGTTLKWSSRFVTTAIAAGVTAGIMVACDKSTLRCILALGVAYNRVGKRRLIWDGQNVNAHLVVKSFRMETLQNEGRSLLEQCAHGDTMDASQAYHHVEMHEAAQPHLSFKREGVFHKPVVLPFLDLYSTKDLLHGIGPLRQIPPMQGRKPHSLVEPFEPFAHATV